jgi:hypothetical protein
MRSVICLGPPRTTICNGFEAGGDYHSYELTAGSPGHNAASDGTDVGVNFAALDGALGGAVSAGLSGTAALSGKGTRQ